MWIWDNFDLRKEWKRSFPSFEEIRRQQANGTFYHLSEEEISIRDRSISAEPVLEPLPLFESVWDGMTNRRNRMVKAVEPVLDPPKDYSYLPKFIKNLYGFWNWVDRNLPTDPDEYYREFWRKRFQIL